jgi:hypothetical protein
MPTAKFVAHLTTVILGTISGIADLLDIDLDADLPLRSATPRNAAVG